MPTAPRFFNPPSAGRCAAWGCWAAWLALACALFSGRAGAADGVADAARGAPHAAVGTVPASSAAPDPRHLKGHTQPPGQTRWRWAPPDQPPRVWQVPRDAHVPPAAPLLSVQLLAATDAWLLVRDSYPSRLNQGQGACGAGEEVFLRVLRLQPARQTLQVKLASCWQNLELDASAPGEGVWWDAAGQTLQVRWLPGSAPSRLSRRWRVGPDGAVQPQ